MKIIRFIFAKRNKSIVTSNLLRKMIGFLVSPYFIKVFYKSVIDTGLSFFGV